SSEWLLAGLARGVAHKNGIQLSRRTNRTLPGAGDCGMACDSCDEIKAGIIAVAWSWLDWLSPTRIDVSQARSASSNFFFRTENTTLGKCSAKAVAGNTAIDTRTPIADESLLILRTRRHGRMPA